MKRETLVEVAVFAGLVAVGTLVRVALHDDYPNFAPVAAIALFAGYFFRSSWLALATPIAIMMVSNSLIEDGGYAFWSVMLAVYGCLAAPVVFSKLVRRFARPEKSLAHALVALAGLFVCAPGSSILFFTVTNFAHWAATDMYPHTLAGLATCYTQALVFFNYTLAGDMFFACLLFGGYAASTIWEAVGRKESEVAYPLAFAVVPSHRTGT